ncbi:MAG: cellulose biosynthesis cyclic di-GMP-binding regulatory protein BcsB [Acetobacter orientalis]|uniref:cellulose biosynthesis cyclic di-GMP-binding regulatory protein BcsB n=1 Tax=Acetobacter orientalis TaxID=146474 RepID=UPI0039E86E02
MIISRYSILAICLLTNTALLPLTGAAAYAGEVADTIRTLSGTQLIHAKITLKDLGVTNTVQLASDAANRELYVPVPASVPLVEPSFRFKSHYLRADGGRTTYTLAFDGNTVAARSPVDEEGDVNFTIGVDGAPRTSGFIRVGFGWSSAVGRFYCDDSRSIGNVLNISPESWLEYSYNPSFIHSIASAWSVMLNKTSLMVASGKLQNNSYETAWRLGVALEHAGKELQVISFPQPGNVIDVTGINVPSSLENVPAFAALKQGGRITIRNDAEIGAILLLAPALIHPDVVVADQELAKRVASVIAAVRVEIVQADAEAAGIFDALVASKNSLISPVASKGVDLRMLGGRPVIAVAADAGRTVSGLFDELWRKTAVSKGLIVNAAGQPENTAERIPLVGISQNANTLDVVGRADWTTSFDLSSSLVKGRVPKNMDLHVAAAPGATSTSPVVSVFINDYLLGARRLTANGHPERINVKIPTYALQARNTVRVEFQRQPSSNQCREQPQGFPVAVLPDSSLSLGPAQTPHTFADLVPWLTGDAMVMVPDTWRNNALKTLPVIMHISDSVSISPVLSDFMFVGHQLDIQPKKPFLAFDVKIHDDVDTIKTEGQRISIADKTGSIFYDVSGLNNIAVIQAITETKNPGLSYHTVGDGPEFTVPFRLIQGDIAVLGAQGVLAEVNTSGVASYLSDDGKLDVLEETSLQRLLSLAFWEQNILWVLTIVITLAFLLFLLRARYVRKRHDAEN